MKTINREKIKIFIKNLKKANDPDLMHYASSLSYHTILSTIPLLLISLSLFMNIPSFSEYFDKLKDFVISLLAPAHKEVILGYLETFLQNTIKMGVMGFIVVLFVTVMFFKDYESIINKIMNVKPRSFWQSLSAYWTLITLAPIGLVASFYLSNIIQNFLNSSDYTNWINFLTIFPYLVVWMLFFTIYMISSNAKISFKSGIISSFVASLIWYSSKSLFVYYVAYNKTYLTIYGSFSILLFFFIWIYASWVIFLYGVRLCHLLNQKELQKKEKIANSDD
ncbi:MAG: YihY family inner membrane protein [Campylobacteraceae bacterium]|jgi:membrane protein|nr:YihY family inner membrane protein [Campylobacteraceae bacterium]